MTLATNWVDNIGMFVNAAYLNQVGTEVNANTNARNLYGLRSAMPAASASNSGAAYFCTDCDAVYQSNGTTWTKIRVGGFGGTFADPPSSGWSTTSLGTATFTQDKDGRMLTIPAGVGYGMRAEYRALPASSNYTITAYFAPHPKLVGVRFVVRAVL